MFKNIFEKNKNILKKIELKNNFKLLDIGAAGNIKENWKQFENILDYTGIEPDEKNYDFIKNRVNECKKYKIINIGLSNKMDDREFKILKKRTNSSIFEPNYNLLKNFHDYDRWNIIEKKSIKLNSIDNLNLNIFDFVKIDTQGSEMLILEGGEKTFKDTLGFEIETSFIEIYKTQPLFSDVYNYLTRRDYLFTNFFEIIQWDWNDKIKVGKKQFAFADSIFIRPLEYILDNYKADKEILFKYSIICLAYNYLGLSEKVNKEISGELGKFVNQIFFNIVQKGRKRRFFKKFVNKIKNIL